MKPEKAFAQDLIDFLYQSPTPYHVVATSKAMLKEKGFQELKPATAWQLEKGGKYYVSRNDSAIVAFVVGLGEPECEGFRLVGAHTDAPAIRIKATPEIIAEKVYLKLNAEIYGGPILNTWLDRPLALAGRVSIKGENVLFPETRLINFNKPLAVIPNIAVHMNRTVNEGFVYNKQKDMLPLVQMVDETFTKDGYLQKLIAEELEVTAEDILGFDLFLYDYMKGQITGINDEFISVGRLDDLAMSHAALMAIANSQPIQATCVAACFDNEEIGSRTKQGAGSTWLGSVLERITLAFGKNKEDYYRALHQSFLISSDMAHAVHPNAVDKHDPTNRPVINKGPVVKINVSQKYTTDSDSEATFKAVCAAAGIPVQMFHNRNDARSGGTIGPIVSSLLNVRSVDIGNPMLAMHSIRELCGVMDHYYLKQCFETFYRI